MLNTAYTKLFTYQHILDFKINAFSILSIVFLIFQYIFINEHVSHLNIEYDPVNLCTYELLINLIFFMIFI